MKLSIVTTLYKSSPYIDEFYERVSKGAQKITQEYEIVFVDDGSPDDSLQKAIALYEKDTKVKVIELSRNFGHHKAIMTGLSHAKGEFIFLLDSDLEEEPELLGKFWEELHKDSDTDVVGAKQKEIRKTALKESLASKLFYKVFNHMADIKIPHNELVARLMRRNFVDALLKYEEKNIFLPGIWNSLGFKLKYIDAVKSANGNSTYTLVKKIILSTDAIISFSIKPLIYLSVVGLFIFITSFIFILYLILQRVVMSEVTLGWTSVIASIWSVGGMIMFSLGVIGMYLAKVLSEVKSRPLTIIKKIYKD